MIRLDNMTYAALDPAIFTPSRLGKIRWFCSRCNMDCDEVLAACREDMWKAFGRFDWNRAGRGGLPAFANVVMRRTFSDILAQKRRNRDVPTDEIEVRDDQSVDGTGRELDELYSATSAALGKRERAVMALKFKPNEKFSTYAAKHGLKHTNASIGKFLGLTKNQVDWCVHTIQSKITYFLSTTQKELGRELADSYGWPLAEYTPGVKMNWAASKVQRLRGPRVKLEEFEAFDAYVRRETYAWGFVLYMECGAERGTMVLETQRVNWNYGFFHGSNEGVGRIGDFFAPYVEMRKRLQLK